MGNWLAMETLRQLAIGGNRDLSGKLGYVVLASPDIDVDIFKKQMARYGKPDKPFVVLLSADDKALRFSSLIAGKEARVGDDANADELAALGVTVVDLSATRVRRQAESCEIRRQPGARAIARRTAAHARKPAADAAAGQ